VDEYVSICSLQTHTQMKTPEGDVYVTEQIYVHSKLMIVDDRRVFIGSANINDRSMMGDRDSELVAVFEGRDFAQHLRIYCMAEHLGLLKCSDEHGSGFDFQLDFETLSVDKDLALLEDPESAEMWELWCSVAQLNSETMAEAFPWSPNCLGVDACNIRTSSEQEAVEDLYRDDRWGSSLAPMCCLSPESKGLSQEFSAIAQKLRMIQGHLVQYPLFYLCDDKLLEGGGKEAIVPKLVFQ